MNQRGLTIMLAVVVLPLMLWAQTGIITGQITDSETGDALVGANVIVVGTSLGAAADADGMFAIMNVPIGTQTITASVIGFEAASITLDIAAGGTAIANIALSSSALQLTALEVFANRATRNTPVAYSNISKADMSLRLGSQDIPLVLNTTPSVYATMQGGAAGDARISVRGFNQRNVAIQINGVPVNDMENGWLYWSNWDGVGDATSSIQLQRGLSADNLATPSVGGSMNIITDPAAMGSGLSFKQEIGNDGFFKSTLGINTGLIGGKYALSANLVKKVGDGIIDGTWTDAMSYYLGASYTLNANNRFEVYAVGAPQRHGQNLYKQNIAVYDQDFARGLDDYDVAAFDKYHEAGRFHNQNWADVDASYAGEQAWGMYSSTTDDKRFLSGQLMERQNFFHKPQVSFNWYTSLSDAIRISSTAYWSGGHGGGTGTLGSVSRKGFDPNSTELWFNNAPWIWDWDKEIAQNADNIDTEFSATQNRSTGILRNSRNNQWTIGAISKAYYRLSDAIRITGGIDWRTAEITHFREVRDLLGGDYYVESGNEFDDTPAAQMKGLGDIIAYHNTNTVNWLGFFGQGEFTAGPINAYGVAALSTIAYDYEDFFKNVGGNPFKISSGTISGSQLKGGASFALSPGLSIFGNLGLVSKVPIFDDVIDDVTGIKNEDVGNQKFTSVEGGVNFATAMFSVRANAYFTQWRNRTFREQEFELTTGEEVLVFLRGVDATHSGIELEATIRPMPIVAITASASVGNWVYDSDSEGNFRIAGTQESIDATFYIKDLKVGDAPQTQVAIAASVFPLRGLTTQFVIRYYANHYADFSPFTRVELEKDADGNRIQSWLTPSFSVIDFHGTYDLPISLGGARLQAFAHVFNLLDAIYIQDATDNSPFNAWDKDHDADDAEVFFGLPRTFNVGLAIAF